MKQKIMRMLAMATVVLGLASCNNSEPGSSTVYFLDIVSYDAESAGGSTFTVRKNGDSELVTYTTPQKLSTVDFKVGTRVLISYTNESQTQYVSGPITLAAAANVEGKGDPVQKKTAEETADWASDKVSVASLFRSGEFINIQFSGALGSQKAIVEMYLDSETADSEYPELHLIFGPYTGYVDTPYMFYGSWSIANIWSRPDCKGIKVFYNSTSSQSMALFEKASGTPTPSPLTGSL